jgi:hypothetical protein
MAGFQGTKTELPVNLLSAPVGASPVVWIRSEADIPPGFQDPVHWLELLAGQWLSAQVCSHCGHPPDDFVDEETVVE